MSHLSGGHDLSSVLNNSASKGRKLLQQIDNVHTNKVTPPDEFLEDDIKNGWSEEKITKNKQRKDSIEAFKKVGESTPGVGNQVLGDSDYPISETKKGKSKRRTIISLDSVSPRHQIRHVNAQLTAAQVNDRLPPLNRLSDVMWTVWKGVAQKAGTDPNSLRYICCNTVNNTDTKSVMTAIFKKQPERSVLWPGHELKMDSEEGLALLGTPNGLATAYLLKDRGKELGRRRLRVRIFADSLEKGTEYRMVWDMAPE
ncbi:MAG: hypothetical protein Q9182_000914 [Xanthomendoza sp. 2 TL-2023]